MGKRPNGLQDSQPNNSGNLEDPAIDYERYTIFREGAAEILTPKVAPRSQKEEPSASNRKDEVKQNVFYNPIQQFNRDLSVLAIKAYAEDLANVHNTRRKRLKASAKDRPPKGPRGEKRKRDAIESTAENVNEEPTRGDESRSLGAAATAATLSPQEQDSLALNGHSEKQKSDDSIKVGEEQDAETSTRLSRNDDKDDTEVLDKVQTKVHTDQAKENESTKVWEPNLHILDALSATGLRALRYAKEISQVGRVHANDLSISAAESIKRNTIHNKVQSKVKVTVGDATEQMYRTNFSVAGVPNQHQRYHVIDLDPYGTAAPFLDAAVQAVRDGGLLCITCTDSGVYASVGYLEKTFSQYGGLSVKGPHAHEAGLRLILNAVATSGARYGIAIEPLLSLSVDYYVRVFVRLRHSPAEVKFLASKTMSVCSCDFGCGAWETQFMAQTKASQAKNGDTIYSFTSAMAPNSNKTCDHCGSRMHLAGPMWGGALHNPHFIRRILEMLPELDRSIYQTIPRIEGILTTALEESVENLWSEPQPKRRRSPVLPSNGLLDQTENQNADQVSGNAQEQSVEADSVAEDHLAKEPIPKIPPFYRTNHPFFIHPPSLARALNVPTPSEPQLRGALKHLGYRVTRSHTKAGSIVTDAPWAVVWEVMREWIRQKEHTIKLKPGSVAWRLMQKDRSRYLIEEFKRELSRKLENVQTVDQLQTELQAGLGRLGSQQKEARSADDLRSKAAEWRYANFPSSQSQQQASEHGSATKVSEQPATWTEQNPNQRETHTLDINFDEQLGQEEPHHTFSSEMPGHQGKKKKMVRYQCNPANWGPQSKASS